MSLAIFIRTHENDIIREWQKFAETCQPAAGDMSPSALRDHVHQLLQFIVNDINTPQTEEERSEKSKGRGQTEEGNSVAKEHGELRLLEGFDIIQVHSEFRALRASVLKLWSREWTKSNRDWATPADIIPDLMRFNEAIDQMISESLSRYIDKADLPGTHRTCGARTHGETRH